MRRNTGRATVAPASLYIGGPGFCVSVTTAKESTLLFYGAGGHAHVAIEAARAAGLEPRLVLDDNPQATELLGVSVVKADTVKWDKLAGFRFVITVGDNATRARLFNQLRERGGTPETIIHPFSWISPSARIGAGSVVFGGVVVNADARIGENCILNTGCSVDHDGKIGAHSHLCPGVRLAGNVTIGERTMIGTGSCCIPRTTIGSDVIVGAGSVVVGDLSGDCTAFGNPAKIRWGKT